MALLSDACAADKRLVAPYARCRAAKHFTRDLRRLCTMPAAVARVNTFRQRILTDLPHRFTFLTTPNVPTTDNFAEQSIRHIVIFRKTSFGTRSAQGSKMLDAFLLARSAQARASAASAICVKDIGRSVLAVVSAH